MIIETKNLTAMNEVFKRLNNLRRWTEITTNAKYDEISKQALNCIICFLLAKEAESKGVNVRWENFPKIAIFRAFQKAYVNYDTLNTFSRKYVLWEKLILTYSLITQHLELFPKRRTRNLPSGLIPHKELMRKQSIGQQQKLQLFWS